MFVVSTYNDLYLDIRKKLISAGRDAAAFEARELVCGVLGKSMEAFLKEKQHYATNAQTARVFSLAERLLSGEPLPYLLGEWDFYGLRLSITPDVLIPRADTETLVDCVLKRRKDESFRFLDLCTGSGCVGLAIASSCEEGYGVLADISAPALEVARENVRRLKLAGRVTCHIADVKAPADTRFGMFDIIVSNPPYITEAEMKELDHSVAGFEPHLALCGGEDGMDYYRAILEKWLPLLNPGGIIAFECGHTQASELKKLMSRSGLSTIRTIKDTVGIPRVVSALRPKENTAE